MKSSSTKPREFCIDRDTPLAPEVIADMVVDFGDKEQAARLCKRARHTWKISPVFRESFEGHDPRDVLKTWFKRWIGEERTLWALADKPWDEARKLKVMRHDYKDNEIIDPGVNFFVLTLEHLGATPKYSCEGHPGGFYILFEASYDLAMRIEEPGFFTVALASRNHGRDWWTLGASREWETEREKCQVLRWAAAAWQRAFWKPISTRET